MLEQIKEHLLNDSFIADNVRNRIMFYEYPPSNEMEGIYIVIDPLDVPIPGDYADNRPISEDYLYQVEVWGGEPTSTKKVAKRVSRLLLEMGFGQGSGVDEYDKDLKIFRDARQYSGKFYEEEIL